MQNLSGRKLGNYELRERLGRGGMAEVYKAYQASMDRFVAIKVMLGHLADDGAFIERFKREARAVGRLRHPHIIDIFDFGIEDDIYYMAMEYLTDGNLKEYIESRQRLSVAESVKIARDLADALAYAHKSGMIHRDLKPANIMFIDKAEHEVVLTDFGIARILNATGLTGTGMSVGTPSYMSPEAGVGEDTDERADIYALGIILYEMLVGDVPYNADTPLAVIMKHINAPLPTRDDYGDTIPESVERIMLRCLAKSPDGRFSNAGELRDALDAILREQNVATESVTLSQPVTEISEKNATNTASTVPDVPTTVVQASEIESTTHSSPSPKQNRNPMLPIMGVIIGIMVIAGLGFFFFDDLFASTDDVPTTVAEIVIATETDVPQSATAEPTTERVTRVPTSAPTALPEPLEPIAPPQPWNLQLTSLDADLPRSDARYIELEVEQHLLNGDLERARQVARGAVNVRADMPDYAAQVRIAVAMGDQQRALEIGEFMLDLDARNPNAHLNWLDAMYLSLPTIDYDRALNILQVGQALAPEDQAFVWRRIPLVDDPTEKMALFNEAEPDMQGWRFILFAGEFLVTQGEYQRAIPYLETALSLPASVFTELWRVEQDLEYARAQLNYMASYPDFPLSLGGYMPPQPVNLSVFSQISEILNQAEAMVYAGDLEGAIAYVESLLENDPQNQQALFAKARLYTFQYDEPNIAGATAQELIDLAPDSVWGYIALSDSFLNYPTFDEEGAGDSAYEALQQAEAIDPNHPQVLWRLARLGEWELETERFLRAEERGASGADFIFTIAQYFTAKHDYVRAIPYWEAYVRYAEQETYFSGEAFWQLMKVLVFDGDPFTAYNFLRQSELINTARDAETYGNMAFVAHFANQNEQAREWTNLALALSSDANAARFVQANLTGWIDQDVDVAITQFEQLAQDDAYHVFVRFGVATDAYLEIANLLTGQGRDEEALGYYDRALELDSGLPPFVYEKRAETHLRLGNTEAAREDFRSAMQVEPDEGLQAYYLERIAELGPATDD